MAPETRWVTVGVEIGSFFANKLSSRTVSVVFPFSSSEVVVGCRWSCFMLHAHEYRCSLPLGRGIPQERVVQAVR